MGRGSSKVGGSGGGSTTTSVADAEQATRDAITDFLKGYGRKSIQAITSLHGVNGTIPTRKGNALRFSLSQNKTPDGRGNRVFFLSSNGTLYTFSSRKQVRQKLMELAGF